MKADRTCSPRLFIVYIEGREADLRLIASSNLTGAWTVSSLNRKGESAGPSFWPGRKPLSAGGTCVCRSRLPIAAPAFS